MRRKFGLDIFGNTQPSPAPGGPAVIEAPEETKKDAAFDLSALEPLREYAVTLYNDEVHSTDQVTAQLMKALECDVIRAHAIMMRAHNEGSALVTIAPKPRAFRVAEILREIDLRVTLRQIN